MSDLNYRQQPGIEPVKITVRGVPFTEMPSVPPATSSHPGAMEMMADADSGQADAHLPKETAPHRKPLKFTKFVTAMTGGVALSAVSAIVAPTSFLAAGLAFVVGSVVNGFINEKLEKKELTK